MSLILKVFITASELWGEPITLTSFNFPPQTLWGVRHTYSVRKLFRLRDSVRMSRGSVWGSVGMLWGSVGMLRDNIMLRGSIGMYVKR